MLGRRTLLLSTSSLARTLSWVRMILHNYTCNLAVIFARVWAKHQNGSCWLCCLPWRALWTLPWIQHHLIPWDHLLASCWHLQDRIEQIALACPKNVGARQHVLSHLIVYLFVLFQCNGELVVQNSVIPVNCWLLEFLTQPLKAWPAAQCNYLSSILGTQFAEKLKTHSGEKSNQSKATLLFSFPPFQGSSPCLPPNVIIYTLFLEYKSN